MTPDQAAIRLQLPERGKDLLTRTIEEPQIQQALTAVINGFEPRDVCEMFNLPWNEAEAISAAEPTGEGISVWECQTPRCRQKGKIGTATDRPDCPSCSQPMTFLMEVGDVDEVAHMNRVNVKVGRMVDPLARTDKTHVPDHVAGDFDD